MCRRLAHWIHWINKESSYPLAPAPILLKDGELIGFTICFRESLLYWSENYKFENKLDQFLYVDRIAIRSEYRRQGHAKRMYEDIFNFASEDDLPVTAEVNETGQSRLQ